MAGPCPNARVVPGFTKRAGSTALDRSHLGRANHFTREDRWRDAEAWGSNPRGPSLAGRAQPFGISTSKEQGPDAAWREQDPGGEGGEAEEGSRGGAWPARRGRALEEGLLLRARGSGGSALPRSVHLG